MKNSKLLKTCGSRIEADVIVSLLASCEIEAVIQGDMGGTNPIYGQAFGIHVFVDAADHAAASEILAAQPVSEPTRPATPPEPPSFLFQLVKASWIIAGLCLAQAIFSQAPNPRVGFAFLISCSVAGALTAYHVRRRARQRKRARLSIVDSRDQER